ncbi:14691_t:CDS:2 [Ambispora leptoticha]|uniref:14691_t:CDS:1 n=1 Tax=Ambispora leptoticha TaxID=144679 RepID=A0A9N8VG89_9GLOM|nr:14691_t:CDS:2 [Ambispora leptoticha]
MAHSFKTVTSFAITAWERPDNTETLIWNKKDLNANYGARRGWTARTDLLEF